jgi:type IV pilus assembly protein PilB
VKTGRNDLEIVVSTEEKIKKAIERHYGGASSTALETTLRQFTGQSVSGVSTEPTDYRKTYDLSVKEPLPGITEDAPAAKLFDLVMIQAIKDRASDIHIEPDEKALRIRLRIDGFLYEFLTLPKQVHPSLTSRIKVLAEMDIAETRLPQDGNLI